MRLRVGVVMWFLSWVPYGIILGLDGAALTMAWTFEVLLGVVGLSLAGTELAQAVKQTSWKRAPAVMWHALIHGRDVSASGTAT